MKKVNLEHVTSEIGTCYLRLDVGFGYLMSHETLKLIQVVPNRNNISDLRYDNISDLR